MKNYQINIIYSCIFMLLSSPAYGMNIQYHIKGMKLLNAVAQGNITDIKLALKNGAYINYQADGTHNSALHIAVLFNHHHHDAIKALLAYHKIDLTLRDSAGRTADSIHKQMTTE